MNYNFANEGFFSRFKKDDKSIKEQPKSNLNLEKYYQMYHIESNDVEKLRKTIFDKILAEVKQLVSSLNRSKPLTKSIIDSGLKKLKRDYSDSPEMIEDALDSLKDGFTADPEYTSHKNDKCEAYILLGEEVTQDINIYCTPLVIDDYIIPRIKRDFSDHMSDHLFELRIGGDGDEGCLQIDFHF